MPWTILKGFSTDEEKHLKSQVKSIEMAHTIYHWVIERMTFFSATHCPTWAQMYVESKTTFEVRAVFWHNRVTWVISGLSQAFLFELGDIVRELPISNGKDSYVAARFLHTQQRNYILCESKKTSKKKTTLWATTGYANCLTFCLTLSPVCNGDTGSVKFLVILTCVVKGGLPGSKQLLSTEAYARRCLCSRFFQFT